MVARGNIGKANLEKVMTRRVGYPSTSRFSHLLEQSKRFEAARILHPNIAIQWVDEQLVK
jgi:hypothetical protein